MKYQIKLIFSDGEEIIHDELFDTYCKCQYKNVGKVEYKNVGFSAYSSAA